MLQSLQQCTIHAEQEFRNRQRESYISFPNHNVVACHFKSYILISTPTKLSTLSVWSPARTLSLLCPPESGCVNARQVDPLLDVGDQARGREAITGQDPQDL